MSVLDLRKKRVTQPKPEAKTGAEKEKVAASHKEKARKGTYTRIG